MQRITAFVVSLLLLISLSVATAPVACADEVYIFSTGKLDRMVTYHGAENTPTVQNGVNDEKAIRLQGTEYLTVDISAFQVPFTLSMWVNWQGGAADQRLFSLAKQDSENYLSLSPFIDIAVVGKPLAKGVALLTSCFKNEAFLRNNYYNPTIEGATDALPANQWHHIAFTVNENDVAVYIDGVNWKTVTLPFTYTELGADTLYIGSAANGLNGFVGLMQGFTLHTAPLDATAIARKAAGIADDDETAITVGAYATATLPTADMLQQTKTVVVTADGNAAFNQTACPFWEQPQIATGQTVRGTLTVQNKSNSPALLQLSEIVLPEKDSPAYLYLSEIHTVVMQNDVVLYEGPYTGLTADILSWRWPQMPNGREFTYTFQLSRPFSSTAKTVDTAVAWKWETALLPTTQNPIHTTRNDGWLLLVLAVSAVAVGFSAYWAIVRRPRRMFTVWDTVTQKVQSLFKKKESPKETQDE